MRKSDLEVQQLEYEIERLKNLYAETTVFQGRIIAKNEKLKEVLRKCSPTNGFGKCYSCELSFNDIFAQGHKEDCEYMKLIK